MKIHPVTAQFFCADGRTDMTKLIVIFRNFANVSKSGLRRIKNGKTLLLRIELLHASGEYDKRQQKFKDGLLRTDRTTKIVERHDKVSDGKRNYTSYGHRAVSSY
jgi:hypothetical protein